MNRPSWILALFLMAISAFGGNWFAKRMASAQTTEIQATAAAESASLQAQVDQKKQEADDADRAAAFNHEARLSAERTVQVLAKKLAEHPRPAPIPADTPLVEVPNLEAARMPAMEARLTACENLVTAQAKAAEKFRAEIDYRVAEVASLRDGLKLETKRAEVLRTVALPPRWDTGVGSFLDQHAGKVRPAFHFGTHLDRSTTLGSTVIPGAGVLIIATHSWGHL